MRTTKTNKSAKQTLAKYDSKEKIFWMNRQENNSETSSFRRFENGVGYWICPTLYAQQGGMPH
jgi:hypothetical protein